MAALSRVEVGGGGDGGIGGDDTIGGLQTLLLSQVLSRLVLLSSRIVCGINSVLPRRTEIRLLVRLFGSSSPLLKSIWAFCECDVS